MKKEEVKKAFVLRAPISLLDGLTEVAAKQERSLNSLINIELKKLLVKLQK
jgi:predicted HicB family RNase H-like nuclease